MTVKTEALKGTELGLCIPQLLEDSLAHSRYSINTCRVDGSYGGGLCLCVLIGMCLEHCVKLQTLNCPEWLEAAGQCMNFQTPQSPGKVSGWTQGTRHLT